MRVRYARGVSTPAREPSDKPKKPRRKPRARILGLFGVGLDGKDGQTRITKGDEFVLYGGSAETHERMQDLAMHVSEGLKKKGKRISDATPREIRDLVREIG